MIEKRTVIKKHVPLKRDDLILSVGEEVEIGREDASNPLWKNWVWCNSKTSNLSGWVPKQHLHLIGNTGTVIKNYSSVELPVTIGDELTIHFYLNGWGWCTETNGNQGWVPKENFE